MVRSQLKMFEADLHSASQSCHKQYIRPIHIYRLNRIRLRVRNHLSYSVLLSPFLSFDFRAGVGHVHQSKEIHRRFWKICSISDQNRTPIFSVVFLWKNPELQLLQPMLSCSVVALLSSLLGLVGLAGLGHHYYHHSPHGSFQWDEVKDWSHDHRHGHSMEAMKQILWWG